MDHSLLTACLAVALILACSGMSIRSALTVQSQPGGMFAIEDSSLSTGSRFFVNSVTGVDVAGNGADPDHPFATIAFALTKCTDSVGDIIYCMPGHVETLAAGVSLAVNKIGVSILGLGRGNNRPIISFTGVDAVIAVSAASCLISNIKLKADIDEVVKAISVTAAFLTIDRVDITETSAKQFIQFCLTTAAATDLTIQDCRHHQSTASASNALWIQLVGADRAKILRNRIFITTTNSASSSVLESDTTAPVNVLIEDNVFVQLGGTGTIPINLVAGTSGFARNNHVASAKTAIAGSIALASCYGANNYASHVVNKNGLLEPVVDA